MVGGLVEIDGTGWMDGRGITFLLSKTAVPCGTSRTSSLKLMEGEEPAGRACNLPHLYPSELRKSQMHRYIISF